MTAPSKKLSGQKGRDRVVNAILVRCATNHESLTIFWGCRIASSSDEKIQEHKKIQTTNQVLVGPLF